MTLPRPRTWTVNSIPEWGKRCDRCKRWRLHARYHEFHGAPFKDQKYPGARGTWWRECMDCSFATVAAWGEEWKESFLETLGEELEAQS